MSGLAVTRPVERPATKRREGWTDHGGRLWSWTSPTGAVSMSVSLDAEGNASPPSIIGVGRFHIVSQELERACEVLAEWLRDMRAMRVGGR